MNARALAPSVLHMTTTAPAHAPTDDEPVLIACEGSDFARLGIPAAARLWPGRRAVVAVVWTPATHFRPADMVGRYHGIPAPTTEAIDEGLRRHAEGTASDAERIGDEARLHVTPMVLSSPHVAETLAEVAESVGAVAIVVGTNDHGLLDALPLGRVTRRLAHLTQVPLLLVPEPTSRSSRSGVDAGAPAEVGA